MRTSTTWAGTMQATSSIAHDGERRGTVALLRRERVRTPAGEFVHVPLISGNSLRGGLRRIACDVFVQGLELEGELSLPAGQLLRGGGGALHRSPSRARVAVAFDGCSGAIYKAGDRVRKAPAQQGGTGLPPLPAR